MYSRILFCGIFASALLVALRPLAAQQSIDPYAKVKSVYFSDDVLRAAVADIARMKEPELRAFVRYLSECANGEVEEVSKHACVAAFMSYEIEFGSGFTVGHTRPLDDLIYARDTLEGRLLDLQARDPRPTDLDSVLKVSKIPATLEEAAHNRFVSLRSERK